MAAPGFENPSNAFLNAQARAAVQAARTRTPINTGASTPVRRPTASTVASADPMYAQALAQARAALQAQIDPLNAQIAQNDAAAKSREGDAIANATALANLLKGIAPAIQGMYSGAAQEQGILGKGFSGAVQDTLDSSGGSINDMLAKINAPVGQDVSPDRAANAADVLYALGGYIPGTSFAQQGADYAASAARLPAAALLQGQQNAQAARMASIANDQNLQNKIAELAAKLPGDAETNYQKLQQFALENSKFAESLRHDKVSEAQAAARIRVSTFNAKTNAYYKGVSAQQADQRIQQADQRLQLDANKFARQQFQQDRQYAVSLARLGISQKRLQLSIAAAEYKQAHGGYTPAQLAKFGTKLDALEASGAPTHSVPSTNPGQSQTMLNGNRQPNAGGMVTPTPQYQDKSGKWQDITPDTAVPRGAKTRGTTTYANFIRAALSKGIPLQLVLQRANTIWPETQRGNLGSLADLPAVAEQAAQQAADYAQTTGQTPARVSDPGKAKLQSYAFSQFSRYRWAKPDMAALQSLWDGESGWNPNAKNGSSGAAGIPQALGHTLPADYMTNPKSQINWGLDYIKARYGSPTRAWAFWQATVHKNAALAPRDLQPTASLWISKGYAGY